MSELERELRKFGRNIERGEVPLREGTGMALLDIKDMKTVRLALNNVNRRCLTRIKLLAYNYSAKTGRDRKGVIIIPVRLEKKWARWHKVIKATKGYIKRHEATK